jgi:hypothetical protein
MNGQCRRGSERTIEGAVSSSGRSVVDQRRTQHCRDRALPSLARKERTLGVPQAGHLS